MENDEIYPLIFTTKEGLRFVQQIIIPDSEKPAIGILYDLDANPQGEAVGTWRGKDFLELDELFPFPATSVQITQIQYAKWENFILQLLADPDLVHIITPVIPDYVFANEALKRDYIPLRYEE